MKAEIIAKALGGRKAGAAWMARCPAHDDRDPSLSIQDANGKVLVRCHAGCDQARVIAKLRSRGLWEDNSHRQRDFIRQQPRLSANDQPDRDDGKRTESALTIWQATTPAGNTLVESYLVSRGLRLPPPPTLRFHAGLKHPSGGIWPAMVALVTRGADDAPIAIHRTFLARDGAEQGADRSAEDDARPLPWRRGEARLAGRRAHGRRRHRNLPRRYAGHWQSGLGGTLDIGAAHARSARRSVRRDRARRWRRSRRGGGA